MAVDQAGDDVFDVGLGFDVVEFAGGDERRQNRPVVGAFVRGDLMMPGVWGAR